VSKPRIQPPSGSVCGTTGAGVPAGPIDTVSTRMLQVSPGSHTSATEFEPALRDAVAVTVDQGLALSVGAATSVVARCPFTTRSIVWAPGATMGPGTFE
jgi:hypothetical protein